MNSARAYVTSCALFPDLKFFLDDSLDYLDHIDQLLKGTTSSAETPEGNE